MYLCQLHMKNNSSSLDIHYHMKWKSLIPLELNMIDVFTVAEFNCDHNGFVNFDGTCLKKKLLVKH